MSGSNKQGIGRSGFVAEHDLYNLGACQYWNLKECGKLASA